MSKELSTPLQNLLSQAKKLPATGDVSRLNTRMANASDTVCVLADVSSSMSESAGAKRKIDHLLDALKILAGEKIIAFNSSVMEIQHIAELPQPSGGTALHLALECAARFRPHQTVVVSDGRPDSANSAFAAADKITGTIDVIYCGPDDDTEAIAFMNRLTRRTGGQVIVADLVKRNVNLLAPIRRLLSAGK